MSTSGDNQPKSGGPGSGRGGRRAGSGRPFGAATVKTREVAEKALAEGITPLEVMLAAMRKAHARAVESDDLDTWTLAAGLAKDAAPYMHPRLAAIEHTGKGGGPIDLSCLEWLQKRSKDDPIPEELRPTSTP